MGWTRWEIISQISCISRRHFLSSVPFPLSENEGKTILKCKYITENRGYKSGKYLTYSWHANVIMLISKCYFGGCLSCALISIEKTMLMMHVLLHLILSPSQCAYCKIVIPSSLILSVPDTENSRYRFSCVRASCAWYLTDFNFYFAFRIDINTSEPYKTILVQKCARRNYKTFAANMFFTETRNTILLVILITTIFRNTIFNFTWAYIYLKRLCNIHAVWVFSDCGV